MSGIVESVSRLYLVLTLVTIFVNVAATTEIYTLALHDALPIWERFEDGLTSLVSQTSAPSVYMTSSFWLPFPGAKRIFFTQPRWVGMPLEEQHQEVPNGHSHCSHTHTVQTHTHCTHTHTLILHTHTLYTHTHTTHTHTVHTHSYYTHEHCTHTYTLILYTHILYTYTHITHTHSVNTR